MAADFFGLGDLAGGDTWSEAFAISADTSTVVGQSAAADGYQAFRWTAGEGLQPLLERFEPDRQSVAHDVSADGSVVVGGMWLGRDTEAFRWTSETGPVPLGDLPGEPFSSLATGVSADGSVIVGTGNYQAGGGPRPVTGEAFLWTADGGLLGLGDLPDDPRCSRGLAVSADAFTVVGKADCGSSFQVEDLGQAAVWTEANGWRGLGFLSGGDHLSVANAISGDGSVIAGSSRVDPNLLGGLQAFRWTAQDGMQPLFDSPYEHPLTAALDVNEDGSVIVGQRWDDALQQGEAFVWDALNGPRDLSGLLEKQGLADELNGWHLELATSLSADGFTVVGNGVDPHGRVPPGWPASIQIHREISAAMVGWMPPISIV